MSTTFKKTTLALAVAFAMVPFAASAATVTYDADGAVTGNQAPIYAQNVFGDDANVFASSEDFILTAVNSDGFLGRTTGMNVRITLDSGLFDAVNTAAIVVGAGLPPSDTPASWTITTAGGGAGADTVTLAINPPASGTGFGVVSGAMLTIPAGALSFTELSGLATGGVLTGTVQLQDSVGGGPLGGPIAVRFIQTEEGVVVECDPSVGNVDKRIDVALIPPFAAKTRFSDNGSIGGSEFPALAGPPASNLFFNAGAVDLSTQGFTGGAGAGNDDGAGNFVFDAANDTFTVTVNGTNFTPFNPTGAADRVYISTDADCVTGAGVSVAGTVNAAGTSAEIEFVLADLTLGDTGGTAFICLTQGGATLGPIAKQALSATVEVDLDEATNSDPAAPFACELLPLLNNGSVVDVYHLNPAGNTSAQSFLRVINPSTVAGLVTIEGIDDGANDAAAPITFTLGAGESKQLNSEVLENGGAGVTGAWGDGEGKWRATVTGEFAGMRVQGLNRNTTDNTVTNLTDADGEGEQVSDALFD